VTFALSERTPDELESDWHLNSLVETRGCRPPQRTGRLGRMQSVFSVRLGGYVGVLRVTCVLRPKSHAGEQSFGDGRRLWACRVGWKTHILERDISPFNMCARTPLLVMAHRSEKGEPRSRIVQYLAVGGAS
jgi:hypothetical protein